MCRPGREDEDLAESTRELVRALVPVFVAVLVIFGTSGSATAASASVSVDVALSDQTRTETLSFQFTPGSNTTVSADESFSRDGGRVTFSFDEWEDLDGGGTGTGTSWSVVGGHTYRVTYEVAVENDQVQSTSRCGATSTYSGTAEVTASDGSTVASEPLDVSVSYQCPQFGSMTSQTVDLVFQSDGDETASTDVSVPNTGAGTMVVEEVTFSGVPSGLSASATDVPDRINGGGSGTMTVEVTADSDVSEGTYDFDATVRDNLGNTRQFRVEVQVSKPAVAAVDGQNGGVDLGDVLVGRSETGSFTVVETLGAEGIYGMSATVASTEQNAQLSLSGLSTLRTDPGGSDSASASVSVDPDAPQHADLSWQVRLTPDNQNSPTTTVTMEARVIYPATLGDVDMDDQELTFDQPRSEVQAHRGQAEVSIPNTGDLEMTVEDISVSSDSTDVTATVTDAPDTVAGLSSETATIEYAADADAPEGVHTLTVTVETADAGTQTIERTVRIEHVAQLNVERTSVEYGDAIITKRRTRSIDVSEHLEYESITNLEVTPVGDDHLEYITVVQRPPSTLDAGESAPLVFAVTFDADADLFEQYTWRYRISGDGVETRTITVRATAKPLNFEQVAQPLRERSSGSGWQQRTSEGVLTAMDSLESKLREGEDVPTDDVSTTVALGRSTLLFVDSGARARELQSAGNYSGAQQQVLRTVAAYNMMRTYTDQLNSDALHSAARPSVDAAETVVGEIVTRQTDYYRTEHLGENATVLESARGTRALASLAELRGNDDRATRLRQRSNRAFERYVSLVQQANQKRQQARDLHDRMRANAFATVFGYSVVVNPMRIDATESRSATVLERYDAAASSLSKAGATEEASEVRAERASAASNLQFLRYTAYGSALTYGVVFLLGIWRVIRNSLAYVRDAEAATTGDFLLE